MNKTNSMSEIKNARGLTLIEVMVTVAVVALVGIGILTGISYGIYAQRRIHELNGATRTAAEKLEELKRVSFAELAPGTETVRIYDNGTSETGDDTQATLNLKFYEISYDVDMGTSDTTLNRVQVGHDPAFPIPVSELPLLQAEVAINWDPAGSASNEIVVMSTMLAP